MSDSDDSQQSPSDSRIEQALRGVVVHLYKTGNLDDLTVKRVRRAAEEKLGLEEDFLKNDTRWKDWSKNVINAAVDAQEEKRTEPPPSSTGKSVAQKKTVPTKSSSKTKAAPAKERKAEAAKKPAKRPPPALKATPRKRRKVSVPESESGSSDLSSPEQSEPSPDDESDEESPPKKPRKSAKGPTKDESDNESEVPSADNAHVTTQTSDSEDDEAAVKPTTSSKSPKPKDNTVDDASESEMSVLIDEEPAPKKKRQKKPNSEKAPKAAKTRPPKGKGEESLDPQEAEIKRLQGWLVKCGIRKLWHKELAPYDTSKAKINHLKGMLKDAGMDGRYSAEKARQIKEQRELAADLEAVQEGAKRWGQGESEDDSGGKRPRRRLAKGLRDLAFLDDDEGEESD